MRKGERRIGHLNRFRNEVNCRWHASTGARIRMASSLQHLLRPRTVASVRRPARVNRLLPTCWSPVCYSLNKFLRSGNDRSTAPVVRRSEQISRASVQELIPTAVKSANAIRASRLYRQTSCNPLAAAMSAYSRAARSRE